MTNLYLVFPSQFSSFSNSTKFYASNQSYAIEKEKVSLPIAVKQGLLGISISEYLKLQSALNSIYNIINNYNMETFTLTL